jgi:murein DD-endopeptidase MepM/ murein hydrolase activator NlpD
MPRISVLSALAFAALAAPAAAAGTGGAAAAPGTGGAPAGIHAAVPSARGFAVAPASVAPGGTITFTFRALDTMRARVDLLSPGRPAVRASLGLVRAGRLVKLAWKPRAGTLPPGAYTARLVLTGRGAHAARAYVRASLTVAAPPPPAPVAAPSAPSVTAGAGVFPVQGPYSFGGPDGRFGALRSGHVHQGQDIVAAAGTPVVAPLPGTVTRTAYQAAAAGYYVVLHGADGRDYVFMHFLAGSTAVAEGQAVVAGQRLGLVGATGDADGPHLHFEIWPSGWYASPASQPIDPLPQLQAWAAQT